MRSTFTFLFALLLAGTATAQDLVRYGAQAGAQFSLRQALQDVQSKYNFKFEFLEFRGGTDNILALEQRQLDINTATVQHLLRAVEEDMSIVWVAGWGGG